MGGVRPDPSALVGCHGVSLSPEIFRPFFVKVLGDRR